MGKRKRSKKSRPLTEEEIWDDSALIQSWEAAVEEYKVIRLLSPNMYEVARANSLSALS